MSLDRKASLRYMRCCLKQAAGLLVVGKDPLTMGQNSSLL